MKANSTRIIELGNMNGKGDLMIKKGKNGEPEKIFIRKGATTPFHKLLDKIRGITKANAELETTLKNSAAEFVKKKSSLILNNSEIKKENKTILQHIKSSLEISRDYISTEHGVFNNSDASKAGKEESIIFTSREGLNNAKSSLNRMSDHKKAKITPEILIQTLSETDIQKKNDAIKTIRKNITKDIPFDELKNHLNKNKNILGTYESNIKALNFKNSVDVFCHDVAHYSSKESLIINASIIDLKNEVIKNFKELYMHCANLKYETIELKSYVSSLNSNLDAILNSNDK